MSKLVELFKNTCNDRNVRKHEKMQKLNHLQNESFYNSLYDKLPSVSGITKSRKPIFEYGFLCKFNDHPPICIFQAELRYWVNYKSFLWIGGRNKAKKLIKSIKEDKDYLYLDYDPFFAKSWDLTKYFYVISYGLIVEVIDEEMFNDLQNLYINNIRHEQQTKLDEKLRTYGIEN